MVNVFVILIKKIGCLSCSFIKSDDIKYGILEGKMGNIIIKMMNLSLDHA